MPRPRACGARCSFRPCLVRFGLGLDGPNYQMSFKDDSNLCCRLCALPSFAKLPAMLRLISELNYLLRACKRPDPMRNF